MVWALVQQNSNIRYSVLKKSVQYKGEPLCEARRGREEWKEENLRTAQMNSFLGL